MYDATTDSSELCILDAEDITGPEVARIHLPQRVPFGFHGNWVSDTLGRPAGLTRRSDDRVGPIRPASPDG